MHQEHLKLALELSRTQTWLLQAAMRNNATIQSVLRRALMDPECGMTEEDVQQLVDALNAQAEKIGDIAGTSPAQP